MIELRETHRFVRAFHAAISERDQSAQKIGRFEIAMIVRIARMGRGFWRIGPAAAVVF
jgi:hypothetical protein